MAKLHFFLIFFIVLFSNIEAQDQIVSINFDGDHDQSFYEDYQISTENNQKVLDFSHLSKKRDVLPINIANELRPKASFSVFIKFKLSQDHSQESVLLTNRQSKGDDGWEIKCLENSSWEWSYYFGGKKEATYSGSSTRQNLMDKQFHMLGFVYDFTKNQVWLYFDKENVAILNFENGNLAMFDYLKIGGITLGERESFEGYVRSFHLFDQNISSGRVIRLFNNDSSKFSGEDGVNGQFYPTIKMLTWNIEDGGIKGGNRVGIHRCAQVIKNCKADIVALQEDFGSGAKIADELSFYYYSISPKLSILSRFPIKRSVKIFKSQVSGGVEIAISKKQSLYVFNISLSRDPDPSLYENNYSLNKFVSAEAENRLPEIDEILNQIKVLLKPSESTSMLLAGEFFSLAPIDDQGPKDHYSVYNRIELEGFVDSYRQLYPNARLHSGYSRNSDKLHRNTRQEYIFVKGSKIRSLESKVIDRHPIKFPSKYNAVLTELSWRN